MVTGSGAAQIISIVMAPILTRIYTPADYGLVGLFISISGLFTTLATFQYSKAIILPKEEKSANDLLYLSICSTVIFSMIVLVLMYLLNDWIAELINTLQLAKWLYMVPLTVLVGGIANGFTYWCNRHKFFKRISISRVAAVIFTLCTSIPLGLIYDGPRGLIIGFIVHYLTLFAFLVIPSLYHNWDKFTPFNKEDVIKQAFEHKDFAIFNQPASFINILILHIPVFLITTFLGTTVLGLYNMCVRMLMLPIKFISESLNEVFQQRASENYNQRGSCRDILSRTFKTLFYPTIIPLGIILLFAPSLFAFALGEPWRMSGVYAQYLGIMFYAQFFVMSFASVYYITGHQKEDLVMQVLRLLATVGVFWYAVNYLDKNVFYILLGLTITHGLIHVFYLFRIYQFSNRGTVVEVVETNTEDVLVSK